MSLVLGHTTFVLTFGIISYVFLPLLCSSHCRSQDLIVISVDYFLASLMDIVASALSCPVTIFFAASLASRSAITLPAKK